VKEWIMMLGLGLSICNSSAREAFDPLSEQGVNGANIRVFRADAGVTSAGSATRWRTGVISTDVLGGEDLDPVDGAGFIRLNSGRILHIGGAPLGDGATSVNTIRASDDGGKTWSVIAAHEAGPTYTRFKPGHSLAVFQTSTHGYVGGGDPIIGGNGEIWRTPLDGDGTTWTLVATHAWLASRVLFMWGVLPDDTIVIAGGQTNVFDASTATANYRSSSDGGVTFTDHGNAPWAARGIISGPLPVFDGKLVMVGGGRYDETPAQDVFYDDVWTYDGSTWAEALATGHGQFAATRYNTVVALNSRLWLFTGSISGDADTAAVYTATALGTWTASSVTFAHGDSHARAVIAFDDTILYDNGFQPGTRPQALYAIREHTGALVSSWVDQGTDGLDAVQATDASKPILDLAAFASGPGVVFTRGQILTLAAPDRDITNGIFEVWVIGKTINFDVSSTSAPNPPCTIVGAVNGSSWNNFGVNGGAAEYRSEAPRVTTPGGSGVNTDAVKLIGVQHLNSDDTHHVFVGTTEEATGIGATFSTSWNGWDSIGGGASGNDKAEMVVKMVVIVRDHTAPTGAAFRAGLQSLAY
jgi:hypothetical protein